MSFRIHHFFSGVAIYASGVLVGQALYAFGIYDEGTIVIATLVVLTLFSFFAGMDLQARSIREVVPYSLCWAVIAIVLDVFLTVPVLGWGFMIALDTLGGYVIIALTPLLPLLFRRRAAASAMQSLT